jgi:hypothetical protein
MMLDLESQLSRYGDVLNEAALSSVTASDLSTTTRRLSRPRRSRMIVAVAIVLALAVVATVALVRTSSEHSVNIPPATEAEHTTANLANGVSWVIPDSWQASDVVAPEHGTGDPDLFAVELLAAGTAPRPAGLSGVLCGETPPDPTQAFVSLREYPDGPQPGSAPRPDHFSSGDATPTTLPYCDTPAGVQVLKATFSDHQRGFLVYVVMGSQASPETQAEAWTILDSLRIDAFTPATPDVAAQITSAFTTAVTSVDPSSARAAIDNAERLPQGIRDRIASLGEAGNYKIEVSDIGVLGEQARVHYRLGTTGSDLSSDSSVMSSGYGFGYGYAVARDGAWKVSLDTACQWIQTLGLTCPATTPTT